jgi:oxygen-dependent protoporphyrinogen oxidase
MKERKHIPNQFSIMNTNDADVIIIGAGLTGLTMAYYLNKHGKKVFLIEKSAEPGGVINTISEKGFLFESGPNTGVLSTPEIASLFDELYTGCTLETANPKSKKRYILKNGSWEPLPSGLFSAVSTPLFSFKDKFRILGEPFRRKGVDPDETIASLVVRRLGQSYLDYAVDPFISGIYAGDPQKLVTRHALPKLYALEQNYGSFITGAIKKSREKKSEAELKATKEVFSVRGGLRQLINALCKAPGDKNIIYCTSHTIVEPSENGYCVMFTGKEGENIRLKSPVVISTAGSYNLPAFLPFISSEVLSPLTSLKYAGIIQVAMGYTEWHGSSLDAFGGLIPSKENRQVLGILFPSAMFEGRAPEGGALLSVFLGGVKKPEMINHSDKEIEEIVLREVESTLFSTKHPDLLKIFRYSNAIPQYEKSTGERLDCIRRIQDEYPGLILAGNIRDGIGMADRVKQAKMISDSLINTII